MEAVSMGGRRKKAGIGYQNLVAAIPAFSLSAPGGARFSRVQVPNLPGSGKDIAEGKGVHREVESEGSRMWGTY